MMRRSSTLRASEKFKLPSIEPPKEDFKSGVTIEKIDTRHGYSVGLEIDEKETQNRMDYTRFNKHRTGSETVLYAPPEAGWEPGKAIVVTIMFLIVISSNL